MQGKEQARITAAEKATINKAVQIMRRKCRQSKMCHICPVRGVFCENEGRHRLPMFWEIPF